MKKDTHHIRKQQVDLNFETEEKARHWNTRFTDFYYEEVLPHFSSLLDNAIPDDRSYVIERLEVDLDTIQMDKFQTTFLKKAEEELTRVLRNGAARPLPSEKKDGTTSKDSVRQEHFEAMEGGESDQKGHGKNLRIKDSKEQLVESLTHFLDYGVLPWNSKFDTLEELEDGLRQEIGIEKLTVRADFQGRMNKKSVRQRFYFQFSEDFTKEIFNRLYSKERAELLSLKEELEKQLIRLAKDASSRKKIKEEFSKSVWFRIIEGGPVEFREWPEYFITSAIEAVSLHLKSPPEGSSVFNAIMEQLPSSSSLATYLRVMSEKEVVSGEDKKSGAAQDGEYDDAMDEGVVIESDQDSVDDGVSGLSAESSESERETDGGDKAVQELSDDVESGEKVHEETSPEERIKQPDGGDKDPKKQELSETEYPGRQDSEEDASRPESVASKGESSEVSESGNVIDTGDDAVQELFGDMGSSEKVKGETSPEERIKQSDGEDKGPKKQGASETERSGRPDSEKDTSRSGSDTSKGESQEKMESLQQPGEDPSTDLQRSDDAKDRQPDHPKDLEEYYLRNAGIILSWPYLSRLFENLEYLEDETFKEPQYQQRAVHLLGYIASGKGQCEEHELVLAKFLCAWPLQMPIIRELELTDEEKRSVDEMLSSLISHWSVLKNTSVEGLRESFFHREGKLFKEDEQWKLIVEQESYDMLLDRLPYNISFIKLPWMEEILKVDWA